jgi:cysteine desulfurase/selenocysteine lyase
MQNTTDQGVAVGPCTRFDLDEIRVDFPQLARRFGANQEFPLAYLDNTAHTLMPRQVIEAMAEHYSWCPANVHRGLHALSLEASRAYDNARATVARFINAPSEHELVFTRNTTESINLVAQSWGLSNLSQGDEILITMVEHHSNILPWQLLAERLGVKLLVANVLPNGRVDMADWHTKLSKRTKIASMAYVSNVTGTINPVHEMTQAAHAVGAIAVVDGAQSTPHMSVDVQDIGCDFYAFSSYKMLGPDGSGALWGNEKMLNSMEPFLRGGGMIQDVNLETGTVFAMTPDRFEAGTPAIANAVGFAAAADYLTTVGMENVHLREMELSRYMHEQLVKVPGLRLIGDYFPGKPGIASFVLEHAHAHDVAEFLGDEGVGVRSGQHCAHPLHTCMADLIKAEGGIVPTQDPKRVEEMQSKGCPDGVLATTRASLYLYNTEAEIDQMIAALGTVAETFAELAEAVQTSVPV